MRKRVRLALSAVIAVLLPLMANAQTIGPAPGGGAAVSISNSDGTLTLSPNPITGTGTASLALGHANTWSGVQSFTDGDLSLLGSGSGNSILKAPATGGGTITLPAGTGTLALSAATFTLGSTSIALGSTTTAVTGMGSFGLTGNVSGAGIFGTTGAYLQSSGTVTDTTSTGTVATAYGGLLGNHTWAANSATTITSAYGIFIQKPTAGTNVTLTNDYALGLNGPMVITGSNSTSSPAIKLEGASGQFGFIDADSSNHLNFYAYSSTGGNFNDVTAMSDGTSHVGAMWMRATAAFGWNNQTNASDALPDTTLYRDAANVIGQRNGLNANTLCIYNTYTSSTSYERGCLDWTTSANTLILGTEKGSGGGSARAISIVTGGTAAIGVDASQLVTLPAITTDSTHTDATLCEDTTTHAVYFGSGTLGVCLGTSSLRFKHDIRPMDVGLSQIEKLKPIIYRYNKGHGANPNKDLYGFGAEDVINVLPKLVSLDKQGKPNSVDYVGIIPVLVKAIQQQQAEIQSQAHEIAALQKMRQH